MTVNKKKAIRILLNICLIILLVTGAMMISFIYLENRVNNHIDTGAWFIADNVSEISFTHNGLLFGVIQIVHQMSVLVVGIILARNFNKYIIMKRRLKQGKLQIVEKFGRDLYEIDEVLISVYREADKWYVDVFNNYQDFSYFKREITKKQFLKMMIHDSVDSSDPLGIIGFRKAVTLTGHYEEIPRDGHMRHFLKSYDVLSVIIKGVEYEIAEIDESGTIVLGEPVEENQT